MRAIASLGSEGVMRAIASSMWPNTYDQCRNRRRQNNHSNSQRRRDDTANDPIS